MWCNSIYSLSVLRVISCWEWTSLHHLRHHHLCQVELQSCRMNAASCRMSLTKWWLFISLYLNERKLSTKKKLHLPPFRWSWWRRWNVLQHCSKEFKIWRSFSLDLKEGRFLCFTAGTPNTSVSLPVTSSLCFNGCRVSSCFRGCLICSCFRGVVLCPVGILQSGAEAEADHLAGTRPHCNLWPQHDLYVLLAASALHHTPDQTHPGGCAFGDGTPPSLMRLVPRVMWIHLLHPS